jgi:lysophospholipase L1-like esterase
MSRYPRVLRSVLGAGLVGIVIMAIWWPFGSDHGDSAATARPAAVHSVVTSRSPVARAAAPAAGQPRRAAAALATTRPGAVFVVGDSLTVGTEPWLRASLRRAGWSLTGVDARVGRPVSEGLRILRARSGLPATVIVALGTNDLGAAPSTVAQWLRTARDIVGHRRLVWVNLCLSATDHPRLAGFRQINAALATYAARFGVQIADWCSFAGRQDIRPGPDGIHYSPAAYEQRARFYAAALAQGLPGA